MLDSTVIDEDTATTYLAMVCPHCDGDGVRFVTVTELGDMLGDIVTRYAELVDGTTHMVADAIMPALADLAGAP